MKRLFALIAGLAVAFMTFTAHAVARGTPAEAEALVKRAIAYYQKNGKEKSMDEFSKSPGSFVDRDLYVTVMTPEGDSLAHINPRQRHKNMLDFRDPDGKYAIRVAHTNHRSRREDFDILVRETLRIGTSL